MEDCVLKIFDECDTLARPKARAMKAIIKLSKRKDLFNIFQHKKKLKSVDIKNMSLPPQGSLVFINQSLCSYYNICVLSVKGYIRRKGHPHSGYLKEMLA